MWSSSSFMEELLPGGYILGLRKQGKGMLELSVHQWRANPEVNNMVATDRLFTGLMGTEENKIQNMIPCEPNY